MEIRLSTGKGDGGPVCDQPNQKWCMGRPNDRTCGPTIRIRIGIRIFMNEVRILERKKNLKSPVISVFRSGVKHAIRPEADFAGYWRLGTIIIIIVYYAVRQP